MFDKNRSELPFAHHECRWSMMQSILQRSVKMLSVFLKSGSSIYWYSHAVPWAMHDLMYIPFEFEDGGTRVIHYTPEIYVPQK